MSLDHLHNGSELMVRVANGDRQAFTALYSQNYSHLFKYLLFVTKSAEQAEELLQDIFMKVWAKRSTLVGIRSFEDYLFTMAKNRLFDIRKIEDRRKAALQRIRGQEENAASVFDNVLLKEYERLAVEAFNQLPELRKEIFFLNAYSELTAREISEKLGLPLTTIKKHLYEANHFIRDFLRRYGDLIIVIILQSAFFS